MLREIHVSASRKMFKILIYIITVFCFHVIKYSYTLLYHVVISQACQGNVDLKTV